MPSIHFRRCAAALVLIAGVCLLSGLPAWAQGSPQLVISQVYGAGGNSGASLRNDYVEIFNRGTTDASLNGMSLQYASSTGTGNFGGTAAQITVLPNITVAPGHYYLLQEASSGVNGAVLPVTADLMVTTNPINLSGTAGKIALVNSTTSLGCNGGSVPCNATQLSLIVDLVGYGTGGSGANFFEGSGPAPTLTTTTAALRLVGGCTDTNQNAADFTSGTPNPHNAASPAHVCAASTAPSITNGTAVVEVGATLLLTAAVSPGANPASTGLTVTANLSSVGGSAAQTLFDDGSNGDAVIGNNVFSFSYAVPAAVTPATYTVAVTVSDAQGRNGAGTITLTVQPHAEVHKINELQGAGAATPIDPTLLVKTTGIVTARKSNGFFIQSLPADDDGNVNTSEGIFVYTAGTPTADAAVKNVVEVRGYVHEFNGNTEICGDTLCTVAETITNIGTVTDLPAAVAITVADELALRADPNSLALEKYEGMRVTVPSMTAVAPTEGSINETSATSTSNGIFFGVVTGVSRPFREPGLEPADVLPPGAPCCVPRFDGNPETLRVDSDGEVGAAKLEVTSNAVLTGVTGVLDFGSGFYTILPDPGITIGVTGNMSAVPVPAPGPHEVTVASFNLERFYDADSSTPSGATLTAAAFNMRLAKASLAIRNVLNTPDIVAIEEMNNLTTLQALAARISSDAMTAGQADPAYASYVYDGNDPSFINVAFLVKTSRIDLTGGGVTQEGKNATYINPLTGQPDLVNDRPPLVLKGSVKASGKEVSIPLTVIVNHLRSLSGVNDAVDGPRVRAKRAGGAEFLANLIQGLQSDNIISVGDYNAYEFSDGYVDVVGAVMGTPAPSNEVVVSTNVSVNPTLTDLLFTLPADQRYSYTFDGSAQTLDHFLVNANALSHISRFAYARVDADFPESMRGTATRPERISDHDPGVAYIAVPVDNDPPVVTVTGVADGATYLLGKVPAAACNTTDSLSGVKTAATLTLTGGTANGVGQFTATCSGAVDNVGNAAAPVSATFTVTYVFGGFGSPLGGEFKPGSTLPVKFQLLDGNGNLITTTTAIAAIQYAWNARCDGSPDGGWQTAATTGGSRLRFDPTDMQFVYNWKTSGIAGGCYSLGVKLDDTTTRSIIVVAK